MNKLGVVWGLVVLGLSSVSGQAMAACPGNSLNHTQLANQIVGRTVCAARGTDRWQEYHKTGGDLIDYKKGPAPAEKVDPSKKVGTWSIVGTGSNAVMRYDYGTGGVYSYKIHPLGAGSYCFSGPDELNVTVKPGLVSCN